MLEFPYSFPLNNSYSPLPISPSLVSNFILFRFRLGAGVVWRSHRFLLGVHKYTNAFPSLPTGHNTGYKQNDPSHPCRKCWSKYAKPFSGALAYTPWSSPSPESPSSGTGTSSKSFQRPLPAFRSPQQHIQHRSSPTSYAPPVPNH